MRLNYRPYGFNWIMIVPIIASMPFAGCRSHSAVKSEGAKVESSDNPTPSAPIGGTYCLTTIEQGPPVAQAMHFSYKKTESDGSSSDFEGDLAGDSLDSVVHARHPANDVDREMNTIKGVTPIPIVNGFAENVRKNHFTRADASGWAMGSNGPVQAFTPWGLFIAKPVVKQEGNENVSGFDAVKYSVDTSQQSQLDKSALMAAGRLKDYSINGTAWVDKTRQCILQYNIDYEEDERDGKVNKTHYEGSTTKP